MPVAAPTERESRQPKRLPLPRSAGASATCVIESEIVIIDDDGTEELFDPASWFK
ncbi:hypothetical protein ABTY96_28155 [Streptomyces sp. NPDC096057]|uniref:hypothetical protein n=1 Tax=Streptomyces sp. NPDC096057 TaxID=3155543 RepID=UPI00331E93D5